MNRLRTVTLAGWIVAGMLVTYSPTWSQAPISLPAPQMPDAPVAGRAEPQVEPATEPWISEDWQAGNCFVSFEYLLMKPLRRALDFAIDSPVNDGTAQGTIESVSLNTSSGVRTGGGYRLPEGWELGLYYTYLHSGGDNNLRSLPGGTLYATPTHPGFIDAVDSAQASANLNYSVFDVEFGRRFRPTESFTLLVNAGGRFAWIDQDFAVLYDGQSANLASLSSPSRFHGGGVRVGGEGQWTVLRRCGLYGRAYGSLVCGDFRTSLVETNNAGFAVISNVIEDYRKVVPVAELGFGVSWQGEHLRIRVGYELVNWFGLIDSPDIVHDFSNKTSRRLSDLGLEGMIAQFDFTF